MLSLLRLAIMGVLLAPTLAPAAALDIPGNGASYSGIGVITGWKCQTSGKLTVRFNGGAPLPLAYGNERADVANVGACAHAAVGFVAIWNWANLGDGTHTAVVYDNGVEFARSTFTVTTLGQEYAPGRLKGVDISGDVSLPVTERGWEFVTEELRAVHAWRDATPECTIPDFPAPGEEALFIWNTSTQHLELTMVRSQLWCIAAQSQSDGGTSFTCAIPDFFRFSDAPDYLDNTRRYRAEYCTEAIDLYNDELAAYWTEFFDPEFFDSAEHHAEHVAERVATDTRTLHGQYRDEQACKAALQSFCPGAIIFERDYRKAPERREHTTAAYCTQYTYCLASQHISPPGGADEYDSYNCVTPSGFVEELSRHHGVDVDRPTSFEDCTEAVDWYNANAHAENVISVWFPPYTLHKQYPDKEACYATLRQLCPEEQWGEGADGERRYCGQLH